MSTAKLVEAKKQPGQLAVSAGDHHHHPASDRPYRPIHPRHRLQSLDDRASV